jgi:glyceraldehyde 3-phosphate dehydrogenase
MTKIAINGFGRIGRCFFRAAIQNKDLEIVGINDLGDLANLAYLLKYDTVYGKAPFSIEVKDGALVVEGKSIAFSQEKELAKLPWKTLGVDVVVESTGVFTDAEKARGHLDAGAKRVVISAPAKGDDVATILMGVNEDKFSASKITSNASCTTNAASPIIGILDAAIGIEKAILSTTHGYTASQAIVDGTKGKDWREGRAAAQNIVPTSTGAAKATALVYPQLKGKFDGISLRVPVPAGSIVDVTFIAKKPTTVEEVNAALRAAAQNPNWKKVFTVAEDMLVSSDIVGEPFGSIAQLDMTRVVDGTLVKVLAWYDNEMGYTHTLVEHVVAAGKNL